MRRLFLWVLTLTCATVIGGAANGQITLVPGPQKLVAQSPRYIAMADFNNDKFDDAVVSNSVSNKVTVLFGQDGNSFGSAVDLNVGRVLRGIQAGDLNSDGIPDIATVDLLDSRAFVITGNGDGTFNQPLGYKVGLRPIDVGIGNFDRQNGNDLMTVDLTVNKATVLLNLGGKKGFANNGQFAVGRIPKRGEVADLNGDGYDDIIVVNTGTGAADDVSVLVNTGSGSFQSTPPRNFVVGAGAKDIAIADFNGDGVPDLAVLNGGKTAVQNEYSVSILLNNVAGGKGTAFFSDETPVRVSCPLTLGGIAIQCTPNFIAAGDFDNDGFIDLAISFFTLGNNGSGSVSTAGLITTYKGHGNGTFDFSSQVSVGLDPQGLAPGDFNSDGVTDLVVAERGSRSVRILTAVKPPPLQNGAVCNRGGQCASTFCTDGVCCSTASCPASPVVGEPALRCDIPNTGGICSPPAPIGDRCELREQCNSQFCVDGFCCSERTCSPGEFCNSGICGPPAPNGIPCNTNDGNGGNDQCTSGHCTDNVCCADDRCPAGQSCNIPGSEGVCTATLPPGQPCTDDAQCTPPTPAAASGFCTDLFCCEKRTCPTGQSCGIPGREGLCAVLPTTTPTVTPTPTSTPTSTPVPIGGSCTSTTQCVSLSTCLDTVCCSTATCPQDQFCNIFDSRGHCAAKKGTGDTCQGNGDCASGNCQVGSLTCGLPFTPTPTQTPAPGDPCVSEVQCAGGFLHCTENVCCTSAGCDSGQSCTVTGHRGFCTSIPTPTPTKSGGGQICPTPNSGNGCQSGICTNGVCCDTANCAAPERCDIFGSEGFCSPPLDGGQPCLHNTDCNADLGLQCRFCATGPPDCATAGQYFCVVPPPTSTPVPQAATPTPLPPDVIVQNTPVLSRSGGCSIDNRSDGRNAWLLAALPLIFWMRRFRLHRASVSRRRDWR